MLLSDAPPARPLGSSTTTANVFTVYSDEVTKEMASRGKEKKNGETRGEKGRETKRDDFRRLFHTRGRIGYRLKRNPRQLSTFHRFLVFHRAVVRFDGPVSPGPRVEKEQIDGRA